MPILRFDILEGRSEDEIAALLDAAHRAVLRAFSVPLRDRYQIVVEAPPNAATSKAATSNTAR